MALIQAGKINSELFIMVYMDWKVYRIASGLYFYRKETPMATVSGMTEEYIDYKNDKDAFMAALEDICILDKEYFSK